METNPSLGVTSNSPQQMEQHRTESEASTPDPQKALTLIIRYLSSQNTEIQQETVLLHNKKILLFMCQAHLLQLSHLFYLEWLVDKPNLTFPSNIPFLQAHPQPQTDALTILASPKVLPKAFMMNCWAFVSPRLLLRRTTTVEAEKRARKEEMKTIKSRQGKIPR